MVSEKEKVKTPPAEFYTVRMKLRKDGPLMYISHLDFVRTFEKMLVRSGLPLWYSQGFNPIPKIVFAAPLSVGIESDCELVDIRLCTPLLLENVSQILKKQLVPHLELLDCYTPTTKLCDIGYITYSMSVAYEGMTSGDADRVSELLGSDTFMITKMSKSGKQKVETTLDVRPLIRDFEVGYQAQQGMVQLHCTLSASTTAFLSPMHLLSSVRRHLIGDSDILWCQYVRRISVLDADGQIFR